MLFTSFPFLILVLITFFLFYKKQVKNFQVHILALSSFVFYGYGQPVLLILLLTSATLSAVTSYYIEHKRELHSPKKVATIGVIFNLLVLAFFKYNKLLDGFFEGTSEAGSLSHLLINLPLPVGISFYTFQGISLLIDVFRGEKNTTNYIDKSPSKHFLNTVFYITFFPQLVAGPIVKAHDFYPQINQKSKIDINWNKVVHCLILGYFLKTFVADNLSQQTFLIAYPYFETRSSINLLGLLFGYSMQIFADFAGYSYIAIGIAALFGYKLPQNFNYPYISKSIAEFWRRWHISLSSWLKEYLYFSLGGNQKGNTRTYINLIIVMFIGGMWHGAAISYGVWGLWHGTGLAIERFLKKYITIPNNFFLSLVKGILVFSFVSFGWLLFKLTNFTEALAFLSAIFTNTHFSINFTIVITILLYSFPVVLLHFMYKIKDNFNKAQFNNIKTVTLSILLFLTLTNKGPESAFIYFQF